MGDFRTTFRFLGAPALRATQVPAVLVAWLSVLSPGAATAAEPDLSVAVSQEACACQRGPDGLCRRWLQADLTWRLFAPGVPSDLSNDDIERAIVQAFVSWQGQTCGVCAAYGLLPDLPAELTPSAASRPYGAHGCVAVHCDNNPLGLNFHYAGRAGTEQLSSACPGGSASGCPGAEPESGQIAFLRDDTLWPLGQYAVTTTYLTTAADGHILDADILLRNTTRVFCMGSCDVAQWDLRAALIVELGHALGLGTSLPLAGAPTPHVLAPGEVPQLPTYVPPELAACACLAYRYSANPDLCLPADPGLGCSATAPVPRPPAADRHASWLLLLAVLPILRYRSGRSSSVP